MNTAAAAAAAAQQRASLRFSLKTHWILSNLYTAQGKEKVVQTHKSAHFDLNRCVHFRFSRFRGQVTVIAIVSEMFSLL